MALAFFSAFWMASTTVSGSRSVFSTADSTASPVVFIGTSNLLLHTERPRLRSLARERPVLERLLIELEEGPVRLRHELPPGPGTPEHPEHAHLRAHFPPAAGRELCA